MSDKHFLMRSLIITLFSFSNKNDYDKKDDPNKKDKKNNQDVEQSLPLHNEAVAIQNNDPRAKNPSLVV